MNKEEMTEMLFQFKKELRTDLDTDINKSFQANLKPVTDEFNYFKTRLNTFEREAKKNNVILYGLKEDDYEDYDLAETLVLKLMTDQLKINITENNIDYVKRLGKKSGNARPMLIKFTNFRYKLRVLKLHRKLRELGLSVAEDFTKEQLKIRKSLIAKMQEARQLGKYAVIRGTKLIIEEWKKPTKNKKRFPESPNSPENNKNKKFNATNRH